jgi:hypothetical protein
LSASSRPPGGSMARGGLERQIRPPSSRAGVFLAGARVGDWPRCFALPDRYVPRQFVERFMMGFGVTEEAGPCRDRR